MMNFPWSRGHAGLVVLVLGLACAGQVGAGKAEAADSDAAAPDLRRLRMAALDDLFVLREYRAGKNSFVESPERHQGVWTGAGYRYTLLALEGQGSLRHIWTTRGDGDPYFDWEFYVDGESTPSIRATVDLFSVLPSLEDLDAGRPFECRLVKEHFTAGWMKEWSVGPMLNLTYLGRQGTKIDYEAEAQGILGGGDIHERSAVRFWPLMDFFVRLVSNLGFARDPSDMDLLA